MQIKIDTSLEEPLVLRTTRGAVATLMLNRPAQFNALSSAMLSALQSALDEIGADPAVRVVVIGGNGRAFCAGHDLREMQAHPDKAWHRALFGQCSRLMLTLTELPQPVVARVHATATAAGCQLVAASDLAVAGRSARFATSGINLGLFCSTPAVPLIHGIAPKRAAEMLFTGEFVDAELAAQWGLVNRCVDDDTLDDQIREIADSLAAKSFHALASGKALLRKLRGATLTEAYAQAAENMACDMQSADARAGINAFLTRQPMPQWTDQ